MHLRFYAFWVMNEKLADGSSPSAWSEIGGGEESSGRVWGDKPSHRVECLLSNADSGYWIDNGRITTHKHFVSRVS